MSINKKSDPNIIVPTKRIIHKNYDLYDNNDKTSPGGGFFQNMHKYKSVKDFFNKKRKRNKDLGVLKLNSICEYFIKLAAIEFGEGTEWIPEKFKKKETFQNYPFKNALKIFKKFGLNDFRVPVEIELKSDDEKEKISANFKNEIIINLNLCGEYFDKSVKFLEKNLPTNIEEINKDKNIVKIIDNLSDLVIHTNFLENTKLTKNIINNDNIIIFQKGSSIFKVYQKIKDMIKSEYILTDLSDIKAFNMFSNLKRSSKLELVFSTKTSDICGMSSRGIVSCQTLSDNENENEKDGSHYERLVGSILSKYLGICYITDKTDYKKRGEKMLYRSLIRFVINGNTNKPEIVVDKMYPEYNSNVLNVIIEELGKRSNIIVNKIDDVDISKYYIREENFIPKDEKSYQDNEIKERSSSNNFKKFVAILTETLHNNKLKPHFDLINKLEEFLSEGFHEKFRKQYELLLQNNNEYILYQLFNYLESALITDAAILNFIANLPRDQIDRIFSAIESNGDYDSLDKLAKKINEIKYGIYEDDDEDEDENKQLSLFDNDEDIG